MDEGWDDGVGAGRVYINKIGISNEELRRRTSNSFVFLDELP